MSQHIHTGQVQRAPTRFGTSPGWYHVVCYASQRAPCCVAATEETLRAGGGDRLDPGCSADVYGEGVWVVSQLNGGLAIVSVELRDAPSFLHTDPIYSQQALASCKAGRFDLEPEVWRPFATNILGMAEWLLRAEGGTVWFGSHVDRTRPPHDPSPDAGAAWPLRPTDPPLAVRGNQNIYAYTYERGVTLYLLKVGGGADFVVRPQ